MEKDANPKLPESIGRVRLIKPIGKHLFRFFAFVVCAAIFVAAFAVSGIWSKHGAATESFFNGFFHRKRVSGNEEGSDFAAGETGNQSTPSTERKETEPTPPEDAISVYSETLSETVYQTVNLKNIDWKISPSIDGPSVLILCTYPQEAYLSETSEYLFGTLGDLVYSSDFSRSVMSIAETLLETLEQNGVAAIFRYAERGESLQGAHARAATLISEAISRYPSIRYVVDIGRDLLTDANGNCIRTVTKGAENPTAQVLAIVGIDYGDSPYPGQENLAMAEALGAELNLEMPTVFRGVSIRTSSMNQHLSVRSLSLKIGSCANTTEEAKRAAEVVGNALSNLLKN